MKYQVERLDGRDNHNEEYFVIRVDKNAKNYQENIKGVVNWINLLPDEVRLSIVSDNINRFYFLGKCLTIDEHADLISKRS